jgi:hypothetical protein
MSRFILIIFCISFFQTAHSVEIKIIEDTNTTTSALTTKPHPKTLKKVEDLNYHSEESVNTNPDLALQYALRAEKMAGSNKKELARAILNHAIALYYLDEYDGGIKLAKKALGIYVKLNDEHGQGIANNIIGEIYVYTAKYADALSYL